MWAKVTSLFLQHKVVEKADSGWVGIPLTQEESLGNTQSPQQLHFNFSPVPNWLKFLSKTRIGNWFLLLS